MNSFLFLCRLSHRLQLLHTELLLQQPQEWEQEEV